MRRTLHYVFKISNRTETAKFYRDVLGMKVLRHEEFEEGCKAYCNGPYDGKWSKTMVGYGPENSHFACELTYNYGIGEYSLGNDILGLTINSKLAIDNCTKHSWPVSSSKACDHIVADPGGYKFMLTNETSTPQNTVVKVSLGCSNLNKSIDYWTNICGMKICSQSSDSAILCYDEAQTKLELVNLGTGIDHKTAFGRTAISCPREQLPTTQEKVKQTGNTILTELVSLDTPGKPTVEVVILADPDGHEICFVGVEAFSQLCELDEKADSLLTEAIASDKSDEWYRKHKREKKRAE